MGNEAAQPEAVEPAEGQGAENQSEGSGLYDSFLDGIPDGIHDQVIPALKAQDAEFTKKFQARSEQMKPFEELGVFDAEPENIGAYMNLDQMVVAAQQGDEQAMEQVQEWWDGMGEALGFYDADEGEESEGGKETPEDFDPYDPASIDKLVAERLEQTVGPLAEHMQQREQSENEQAALAEAEDAIEAQVAQLQEANPKLSEDDVSEILTMAELFVETDNPIQAGFEKYQSLVGKGENSLFDSKVNQPATPEGSGPAHNSGAVTATSANVKDLVAERLKQAESIG
jgi:hypothetical protein